MFFFIFPISSIKAPFSSSIFFRLSSFNCFSYSKLAIIYVSNSFSFRSSSFAISRSCTVLLYPVARAFPYSIKLFKCFIYVSKLSIFSLDFYSRSFVKSNNLYVFSSSYFRKLIFYASSYVILNTSFIFYVFKFISSLNSFAFSNSFYSFS